MELEWTCEENKIITDEMIDKVEKALDFSFPKDFIQIIKKYNGGYPYPDTILVDGNEEMVNNLVSFFEDDICYILSNVEDTEGFKDTNLIPIAEDACGNYFCYNRDKKIVFWDHELFDQVDNSVFVCNSFHEFLEMLYEGEDD